MLEALENLPEITAVEVAPREAFVIRDLFGLQWLADRVLHKRAQAKLYAAWAKEQAALARRDEEGLLEHFGPQVEAVIAQETRGKSKSVSVPSGRIGFRTSPAGFEVQDEAVYQAWCAENVPDACFTVCTLTFRGHGTTLESLGEVLPRIEGSGDALITMKCTVDKNIVLAHFKRTGELPDGCCYTGGVEKLVITPAKEASEENEP